MDILLANLLWPVLKYHLNRPDMRKNVSPVCFPIPLKKIAGSILMLRGETGILLLESRFLRTFNRTSCCLPSGKPTIWSLWIQTLSEKVLRTLQIIPQTLPKMVLGSIGMISLNGNSASFNSLYVSSPVGKSCSAQQLCSIRAPPVPLALALALDAVGTFSTVGMAPVVECLEGDGTGVNCAYVEVSTVACNPGSWDSRR